MTTLPIVKYFDPLKDVLLAVFAGRVTGVVDKFFLQGTEEALNTTALSQQLPLRLMEQRMPALASTRR